jgi:hypothetical protein
MVMAVSFRCGPVMVWFRLVDARGLARAAEPRMAGPACGGWAKAAAGGFASARTGVMRAGGRASTGAPRVPGERRCEAGILRAEARSA